MFGTIGVLREFGVTTKKYEVSFNINTLSLSIQRREKTQNQILSLENELKRREEEIMLLSAIKEKESELAKEIIQKLKEENKGIKDLLKEKESEIGFEKQRYNELKEQNDSKIKELKTKLIGLSIENHSLKEQIAKNEQKQMEKNESLRGEVVYINKSKILEDDKVKKNTLVMQETTKFQIKQTKNTKTEEFVFGVFIDGVLKNISKSQNIYGAR